MNINDFDHRLKTALDNLEAPYDPSTWDALRHRLDALDASSAPEPVDVAVGSVLRELELPYDPATWAALEQRLDALPAPPALDDVLGPALQGLEAPYEPAHWAVLASRMERERRLRRRLVGAKAIEAILLLLLLLQFGGIYKPAAPSHRWWPPSAPTPTVKPRQPIAAAPGQRSLQTTAGFPGERLQGGTAIIPSVTLDSPRWPAMTPVADATSLAQVGWERPDPASTSDAFIPSSPNNFYWQGLLSPLPDPGARPLVYRHPAPIPVGRRPGFVRRPYYTAVYAASERHRVRTEGDDVQRRADGYSMGMMAGYRSGAWSLEAGIGYAHRAYVPKSEIEIYAGNLGQGYWGSAVTGVNSEMLTVPVRVLRRMAKHRGTSVHLMAGATGQLALQKNYGYRTVYYPGTNPGGSPGDPPGSNNLPGSMPANRVTGEGLAEGGRVRGNLYATADVGIRVEQNLGRRFAAYVEPSYRVGVAGRGDGLRPSQSNAVSVQVGLLARL